MRLFGNAIQNYYGTLSITTQGGGLLAINSAGNVTVGSPASGTGLTVNPSPSGYFVLGLFASPTAAQVQSIATDTSDALGRAAVQFTTTTNGAGSDSQIDLITNKFGVSRAPRLSVAPSGAVSITTPVVAGVTSLTVNGFATSGTAPTILASQNSTNFWIIPSITGSSFNGTTVTGDSALIAGGTGAVGTGILNLTAWSNTNVGIRISGVTNTVAIAGNTTIAAPASGTSLVVSQASGSAVLRLNNSVDSSINFLSNGATKGIRFEHNTAGSTIDGVDNTGSGSFQPLLVQGTTLSLFSATSNSGISIAATGAVSIASPTSGVGLTVSSVVGSAAIQILTPATGTAQGLYINGAAATQLNAINIQQGVQSGWTIYQTASDNNLRLFNAADRVIFNPAGNVTINAPTSGVALTVAGVAGSAAAIQVSSNDSVFSATGRSALLLANANASAQTALDFFTAGTLTGRIRNDFTGAMNYVAIGAHQFFTGGDSGVGTSRFIIATAGNVTINAPTSGSSLTIGGVAASNALVVNSANAAGSSTVDFVINRSGGTANNLAQGPSLQLLDTSGGAPSTILQQSAGQTELWQFNSSWQQILKVLTTRGVVINAPASGVSLAISPGNVNGTQTLTASGLTVSYGSLLLTSSTEVSSSNNLSIGTNAASVLGLYTNALLRATIDASGGLFMAGATGSGQGAGTINATGVFVNGVAVGASGLIKAVKTALTARPSTTTLSNDPDLVLAIPGAGTYVIEAFVSVYNTLAATVGASYNLNYSGTFTAASSIMGVATSATGPSGNALITGTVTTSLVAGNCGTTSPSPLLIKATLVATGAGNLGFAWAQNSSNATATNVGAGSYITATKIA